MNLYEITVEGFPSASCSIEADTAAKARWIVVRDMRSAGWIRKKQWPNVKAKRKEDKIVVNGKLIIIK